MDICFFYLWGLQNLLFANAVKSISLNINRRLHFLVKKSQFLYVDFAFLPLSSSLNVKFSMRMSVGTRFNTLEIIVAKAA
jgi:hypothetical protein